MKYYIFCPDMLSFYHENDSAYKFFIKITKKEIICLIQQIFGS